MIYFIFFISLPISLLLLLYFFCCFLHLIKTGNCWKICSLTFQFDDLAPTEILPFFSHVFCHGNSIALILFRLACGKQRSNNWVMKCKINLFWTPIYLFATQKRQSEASLSIKICKKKEHPKKNIEKNRKREKKTKLEIFFNVLCVLFIIYCIYWLKEEKKKHLIIIPVAVRDKTSSQHWNVTAVQSLYTKWKYERKLIPFFVVITKKNVFFFIVIFSVQNWTEKI